MPKASTKGSKAAQTKRRRSQNEKDKKARAKKK
jgi:hypothetical protein